MDEICQDCGKTLESDAIALCKKILSFRETYCLDCLAKELKVSPECIQGMIRYYREIGCPAFI